MKVRFFYPDPLVLSSHQYPPALRVAVHLLNGRTLELDDAVNAMQAAAPNAVVCAFAGFVAIRTSAEGRATPLIRFDGADAESETFQPCNAVLK
jgi:hypothetical protein